jgi:hypothetical protein
MPVGSVTGSLSQNTLEPRGELTHSRAWSTMKVPVIVACITSGRAHWHDVEHAIVHSDNDAALRLWERLGDGPAEVEAVLRRAGDEETRLEREPDPRGWSSFGRTVWSLSAAAAFYRALARGELLDDGSTARVLDAMGRVVSEQRWGIGAIPGIRFKGGWGPAEDGGYDVIQVGIAGDAVIALAAHAADFDRAKELASKHVPQHPNAPQLRASRDR